MIVDQFIKVNTNRKEKVKIFFWTKFDESCVLLCLLMGVLVFLWMVSVGRNFYSPFVVSYEKYTFKKNAKKLDGLSW